jgi:hypothetical protein
MYRCTRRQWNKWESVFEELRKSSEMQWCIVFLGVGWGIVEDVVLGRSAEMI